MKGIRIPIHGFVELTPLEIALIDSPPMRRLRRIKQLAMCDEVYPGATHTRFEHSIGVMHIASRMFDSIFKDGKGNEEFLRDLGYDTSRKQFWKKAIRLAALLHDVGHPPFSHAGEGLLPDGKKHEDYTYYIIINKLKDLIENGELNETEVVEAQVVASLIHKKHSSPKNLQFWETLIASQIDADRCDYLLRDAYHIGVTYGTFDLDRIIQTITLGKMPKEEEGQKDEPTIAFEQKGRQAVEGLLVARYMMFIQVYYHHTRRSFDYHLIQSLKHILPNGIYPNIENINDYLKWDDAFVISSFKKQSSLNEANINAILHRKHDYCFYWTNPTPIDGASTRQETREVEGIKKGINLYNSAIYDAIREDEIIDREWIKYSGKGENIYIVLKKDSLSHTVTEISLLSPMLNGLAASDYSLYYIPRCYEHDLNELLKGEEDG